MMRFVTYPGWRRGSRAVGASSLVAVILSTLVLVTGCGEYRDDRRLLSSFEVGRYDATNAAKALGRAGFDARYARFGVVAYKLVYRTVDEHGQPTTASGLLALPDDGRDQLPAVIYAHGTTTSRADVASRWNDDYNDAPALTYASAGYAAILPDYLGLGDGHGAHPWMHVPSETSASLEMLRAARDFLDDRHRTLSHDVLVTGFSQGASTALGVTRALQAGADGAFGVAAAAPISGAYDFANTELPALLHGRLDARSGVAYAALLLTSWDRIFDLYDDPATVFASPYDHTVPPLFDGDTPGDQMVQALPASIAQLLTPAGRQLLEHPHGNLMTALGQADAVCDWTPTVPVRLYVAIDDEQAASDNTPQCRKRFGGGEASVTDLGRPDHFGSRHIGSNVAGTAAALEWFLELRPAV
jgi:dienelactone hydrolase